VGSTNRLADKDIIRMLKRALLPKSYDEETYYELNSEAIDLGVASELFKPYRTLTEKDHYTMGILVKEHDITYPSIGGVLLFGKYRLKFSPDAWMQVGSFQGEDKTFILDSQDIKGSLPTVAEDAMKFVQKHLLSSISIKGIANEEIWSIPKIAIREAVINAIVHADYSLSGAPL
jgi:ATP-dependent DNA helicase RecG